MFTTKAPGIKGIGQTGSSRSRRMRHLSCSNRQPANIMGHHISTAIVKPVNCRCNLACAYCYVKDKTVTKEVAEVMPPDVLQAMLNFFCTANNSIEFIWHGGEPLLAGIDFFHDVTNLQRSWITRGKEIYNSIQTNGTLINEEWVTFFAKNRFLVGLSHDGPPSSHNIFRSYPGGKKSHKDVMNGVNLLREGDLFSGIICCVSSANVGLAEETLEYFVQHGIKKIKFNRVRGRGHNGKMLPGTISSLQYAEFICSVFKKWVSIDDPDIEIRELNSIVNILLGGDFRECTFSGRCHKYATVYNDGSIYACDSLPKNESLRFGCVNDDPLTVLDSVKFQEMVSDMAKLRNTCSPCEWYSLCRGGCLQDWGFGVFGNEERNSACEGLKKIFSTIHKELKIYGLI